MSFEYVMHSCSQRTIALRIDRYEHPAALDLIIVEGRRNSVHIVIGQHLGNCSAGRTNDARDRCHR